MKLLPIIFALGTAICWGLYGPVLGKARTFESSAFKPYVFIGVAYLIWAIAGGFISMLVRGEPISFTPKGMLWGFAAGTLGAWGAFCLTMAMFKGGGKFPHVVMAVVFGVAVTVAAVTSILTAEQKGSKGLWIGIAGMLISTIIVAYNTPHAHPPQKKVEENSAVETTQSSPASTSSDTASPESSS